MATLTFLLGLVALVLGAEALVRGASRLALSFGVSPLVVGLTVVAYGTSAPEVAVSVGAALHDNTDVAIGNVVGSNIFNVLFILGASALIVPLSVHRQIIRQEVPIMIGASLLLWWFASDGSITRGESAGLVALVLAYAAFVIVQARAGAAGPVEPSAAGPESTWDRPRWVQILLVLVGLGLLVQGADWLVTAATTFARAAGISDTVIGLTIVAAGTSLPEVATSLLAALRGQRDIAIGNVVGSNIFNILGCLGATGCVAPGGLPVGGTVLDFDLGVMVAVAAFCLPVFWTGREIARWEGALFLLFYVGYTVWTVLAATNHVEPPAFRAATAYVVVPVAAVTLTLGFLRGRSRA